MLRTRFLRTAAVLTTVKDTIATITFNAPESRNAMTEALGDEFKAAVQKLKADSSIRGVIITGSGQAFSAGGDAKFLKARISDTAEGNKKAMMAFYYRFLCVRELTVPVVAACNGHAIGAGLCLALACDLRVFNEKAKYAVNFTRVGIHPGMGATYTLPLLVGTGRANELLVTGKTVTGQEAFQMGLCNASVAAEKVLPTAEELVKSAATASRIAVQEVLKTLRRSETSELHQALEREAAAQALCYAEGKDLAEAMLALKEKREPKFT